MSQQACRAFFDAWNRRDIDAAMDHVADDCHYNDFSFVSPHEGKASVRELFVNVAERAPAVTFRILRITGDRDVGVHWEILMNGASIGSTGVSYYAFDEEDRLVWALDAADPGAAHRTNDFHG